MTYDVILSKKENQYCARVKEWPEIMAYDNKRDEAIRQVQIQLLEFIKKQQIEVVPIEVPYLAQHQGIAGSQLLAFAGCIESDELQKMSQAISDNCAKDCK